MAKRKQYIPVKRHLFTAERPEEPSLRIARSAESLISQTTQTAGLVRTLIKGELIRRNAYRRWDYFLNQVGLQLKDLIIYLEVVVDDESLVSSLKNYCKRADRWRLLKNQQRQIRAQRQQLNEILLNKIKTLMLDFKLREVPKFEPNQALAFEKHNA